MGNNPHDGSGGGRSRRPRQAIEAIGSGRKFEELTRPKTPAIVRQWAENHPDWIILQAPKELDSTLNPKLHSGEMQALSLAKELKSDLLRPGLRQMHIGRIRHIGRIGRGNLSA